MSEKAKLIKEHRGQGIVSNINGFICERCGLHFEVDMHLGKDESPKFCPHCGAEFETERTPDELRDEIKRLYHAGENNPYTINSINGTYQKIGNDNEEEMESLLDELTEIANKNKE